MPDPKDVSLPVDAGCRSAVLRELREGPARQPLRAEAHVRRRAARDDDARTSVCSRWRATRSRRCCRRTEPARPPRSSRSTRRRGAVLAMVGGENYHQNQFNLATQGERQPGSSFKPFVLATALRENIAPSTRPHLGKPVTINADGRLWKVNNYEGEYLGPIDLTKAIAYSDNSVFSQLTALVGPRNVARHGARARDHDEAATATSRSASAPSRRRRSRWRAPTRPSPTAATASTARSSATSRARSRRSRTRRAQVDANGARRRAGPHPDAGGRRSTSCSRASCSTAPARPPQLPGRQVAGKTGTTENYGDAWFVGYTPQFVVAVWVGYPDKLVPMTTEFHGTPVAGGTFPALIWKAFMQKALALKTPAGVVRAAVYGVRRAGQRRQPRRCPRARRRRLPNTSQLEFFGGEVLDNGTGAVATCKANEVEIPDVVGQSLARARARLEGQPLTPQVVYKPAQHGRPRSASSSASSRAAAPRRRATRSRSSLREVAARRRPERRRPAAPASRDEARAAASSMVSTNGRRTRQGRQAVAAPAAPRRSPASTIVLTVRERAADEARAGEAVPPRALGGLRDPDPRAGHHLHRRAPGMQLERRSIEAQPVVLARHPERLAQPARTSAEQTRIRRAPDAPHLVEPLASARARGSARHRRRLPHRTRSSGTSGCRTSGTRTRGRRRGTSRRCAPCAGCRSRARQGPRGRRPRPRRSRRRRRRRRARRRSAPARPRAGYA